MLRHIVMWTLKRPEDAPKVKALLESCKTLVPGIHEFDIGIKTDYLMTMRLALNNTKYPKPEMRQEFFDRLAPRLAAVPGERFDVIASNPPYIAEGDHHLAALHHEPRTALTAGSDGLDDLRHIARQLFICVPVIGF